MKKSIFKKICQNLLLLLLSLTLTFLLIEFFLFRLFLPHLPLKLHGYLPEGARLLAQSSKKWAVPRNYITLVGDSYAQGMGNWYFTSNHNVNPDFHSAHVLHNKTDKDVITLGAGGAGSLRGLIAEPITQFEYLNSSLFYKLKEPEIIFVYFYPGNDLKDNLKDVRHRFFLEYDPERIYESEYFKNFIKNKVIGEDKVYIQAKNFTWKDNFIFSKFLINIISQTLSGEEKEIVEGSRWPPGQYNKVKLEGREVAVPDRIHGPPLMLTEEELKLSTHVFEQALLYLAEYFPNSTICVVYIPAVLACYQISSPLVKITSFGSLPRRPKIYKSEDVVKVSDETCARIKKIAERNKFDFVDSRPFIRRAAKKQIIHGPLDWLHFNQAGYTALAESITTYLDQKEK